MITKPEKFDKTEILATHFNKTLFLQWFRNPETRSEYSYSLWGDKIGRKPSVIMPLTKDFRVIIAQQYRHGADEIVWEFPGGMPNDNTETPEAVALRELEEEIGYTAQSLVPLQEYTFFDPATYTIPFHPFLARNCISNGRGQKLDHTESIEMTLMSIEQLYSMIKTGAVRDGKTIATTFLGLMALGAKIIIPKQGLIILE